MRSGARAMAGVSGVLSIAWLVTTLSIGHAQVQPQVGYEAERQALLDIKAIYERAIQEDKTSLLEPYIHPEFAGVMVTGEQVTDFAGMNSFWEKMKEMMGDGAKYTFDVVPAEKVRIVGDMAYAHGTSSNKVITGAGTEYNFAGRWTALCQKQDGKWKLLRIHDSMDDPVTNEFVLAAISATTWTSGAIGGVAGIVLSALVCLVWARRRRA